MTTLRKAACSCGQLSVTCEGEPFRVSMCHCLACQARTGSVFGVQARFARDQVKAIDGATTDYVRVGDEGCRITFHFCPKCGATVHYEIDRDPGVVAIPVGAFADPRFPPPTISVYESRRHDHFPLPASLDAHHP